MQGRDAQDRAPSSSGPRHAARTREDTGPLVAEVVDIDLSVVADPSLFLGEIAVALGVDDRVDSALSLARFIGARPLLLLLDGFEHVAPAADTVAELIARCPGLRILVTSLIPLAVTGEHEFPIEPMGTRACVALFEASVSHGDVGGDPVVEEICDKLGGIPYAVELAAGMAGTLSPDDLVEGALPETIALCYRRLPEDDQRSLRWLAGFAGSWTTDAARAVCGTAASLESLADHRLIRGAGPGRFAMPAAVRAFALDQLREEGEARAAEQALLAHLTDLAERAANAHDQAAWFDRLADARADLRNAVERADPATAVRVTGALSRFWLARGYLVEGLRRLEDALESGDPDPRTAEHLQWRARALSGAAAIGHHVRGGSGRVRERYAEAVALWARAGDFRGRPAPNPGQALLNLAKLALANDERLDAGPLLLEALRCFEEYDDARSAAEALYLQAQLAMLNDGFVTAMRLAAQAGEMFAHSGDVTGGIEALLTEATAAFAAARHDQAGALYVTAAARCEEHDLTREAGLAEFGLARVAATLGRMDTARSHGERAIDRYLKADHHKGVDDVRAFLGSL